MINGPAREAPRLGGERHRTAPRNGVADAANRDKLHAEIVKAMRSPEVLDRLTQEGAEVVASSPQEYGARLRADIDKWAKVIKQAGIRPE
jgi:tripartite-type tricarboxylate transporter receptor subunit TctC